MIHIKDDTWKSSKPFSILLFKSHCFKQIDLTYSRISGNSPKFTKISPSEKLVNQSLGKWNHRQTVQMLKLYSQLNSLNSHRRRLCNCDVRSENWKYYIGLFILVGVSQEFSVAVITFFMQLPKSLSQTVSTSVSDQHTNLYILTEQVLYSLVSFSFKVGVIMFTHLFRCYYFLRKIY